MSTRTILAVCTALCLSLFTSCATHGIPGHGGGKRFFIEQRVVSESAREAVSNLSFSAIEGKTVILEVTAMGDQGGGGQASASSSFLFGGLGGIFGAGSGGISAGTSQGYVSGNYEPGPYTNYAFANANDVLYLQGLIANELEKQGVKLASRGAEEGSEAIDGTVQVLVHEYGTDQSHFSVWVYTEDKLKASTSLSATFIPNAAGMTHTAIGDANSIKLYKEAYVFGFGPINPTVIVDSN